MGDGRATERFRLFKLVFVPVLVFSLLGQMAVVWTQLPDIGAGHFDFVLYYNAARIVRDGKRTQLYDLKLQRDYQKGFGVADKDRDLPFNHLPYELLLLLPLAGFSFPVAHGLWAAVNLLLLGCVLLRLLPFVTPSYRWMLSLMLFAFFPTLTALKMGQDSVLTTYLLVEAFASLKCKAYARAGGVLALGLYKPQFVLPIAGILFFQRRWPAVAGFLLTAALVVGVSLAMTGWDGLMGLVALWLPMVERGHVVWPELMINLRGLAHMTLSLGGFAGATNLATAVLSIVVYCWVLRLWRRESDEKSACFDLQYALAVVATALVSFHLYSYDSLLLFVPLALTLNHVLAERRRKTTAGRRWFLVALIGLFFPLLPNALLGFAMLAWWALPLPLIFWCIASEIACMRAQPPAPGARPGFEAGQ